MVGLKSGNNGSWGARKRLPKDVQEQYAALYQKRSEEKFYAKAGTEQSHAKQRYNDWLAEIEGRIAAIRAQRKGEGIPLTRLQARALAGEWYAWFVARHPLRDLQAWEDLRDQVHKALKQAVGDDTWERSKPKEIDDLWWEDENLRRVVRPVLADVGETAQFLATKGLTLNHEAHASFLDWLYEDLAAAFRRLMRQAEGDYGDDGYAKRFPKFEGAADSGETPQQLFEKWVSERKPAPSTVDTWRYVFPAMTEYFKDRSAGSITPDEAQTWIRSLVTASRSAGAVSNNWIPASKTIFNWAVEHKVIPRNPFANVKLTVPEKVKLRETQSFYDQEWRTILSAALKITNTDTPDGAARRWVPWLCAYTGARPGEITQLRAEDVIKRDGIDAIRITPAAGAVKDKKSRVVPLHEHLIEQGFLKFVAEHGSGPLFYNPDKRPDVGEPIKQKKPRALQARQRLAAWVRGLGIDDPELSPLHAWRHTFKRIADRHGISPRMSDYITGHAHKSVGARYGAPTLGDMAAAIEKFPRYVVD